MIRILEIFENGTALVSTVGLRRVVIHPDETIADELIQPHEADAFVESFNACNKSRQRRAESIPYPANLASS
jgi:hypothetical protein